MKVMERNEHTVIVIDGKPYGLYREKYPSHNDVCALCELAHICLPKSGDLNLRDLCQGGDDSDAWYFIEDWQHLTERILDFVDLADENYINKPYPII